MCAAACRLLLLLLLLATAGAETVRVATYNVENYGPADRLTAAGFRRAYPKPEAEKRALRAVIRALAADVLVLQEMGTAAHLDELRRDLEVMQAGYPHAAIANAADPDRRVAILSRRPIRVRVHDDLEFAYFGGRERVKRGLLEATIATAGGELTLFAVHLKSRYTDRADDPQSAVRRAAEATAVRNRILERYPRPAVARFLILGDCNDTRDSRALAALQRRGRTRIGALLPAADSRGERWTHFFRREESYSRVDYILASPALAPQVRGGAAVIFDDPPVEAASDHRPVYVDLVLDER